MKIKVLIETEISGETCKGCYFLGGDYHVCRHPDFRAWLEISRKYLYEKRCEQCLERYGSE